MSVGFGCLLQLERHGPASGLGSRSLDATLLRHQGVKIQRLGQSPKPFLKQALETYTERGWSWIITDCGGGCGFCCSFSACHLCS